VFGAAREAEGGAGLASELRRAVAPDPRSRER
jgi:hypothetical protein